jgi:hypothetical protein
MVVGFCAVAGDEIYHLLTGSDSQTFLTVAGAVFVLSCLIRFLGFGSEEDGEAHAPRTRPWIELIACSALAIGSCVFLARGVAVSARFAFITSIVVGVIGAGSSWRRMRAEKRPR